MLQNENGRPCVLIIKLRYKTRYHKFVVPIRSNISNSTPKNQYFSLPPNSKTKNGSSDGIHYIKMFPINDKYIDKYMINNDKSLLRIKSIIDKNESIIIKSCQDYLNEYEKGNINSFSPNIDSILKWVDE